MTVRIKEAKRILATLIFFPLGIGLFCKENFISKKEALFLMGISLIQFGVYASCANNLIGSFLYTNMLVVLYLSGMSVAVLYRADLDVIGKAISYFGRVIAVIFSLIMPAIMMLHVIHNVEPILITIRGFTFAFNKDSVFIVLAVNIVYSSLMLIDFFKYRVERRVGAS